MKRLICACLCAVICCGMLSAGARAEDNWDDFFRSLEGRISFTFPCAPNMMREDDVTEEKAREMGVQYLGWLNKKQVVCGTKGGGSLEVHIGDLSPMLAQIRRDHPDSLEINNQANALVNLAYVYIVPYNGDFLDMPEAGIITREGKEYAEIRFEFAYEGEDGVYLGRGIMDGSQAVMIMGREDDDEACRIIEGMNVLTAAEAEAFLNRPPETICTGSMRVTFPRKPDREEDDSSFFFDGFGADYTYMTLEYFPADMLDLFSDAEEGTDPLLEATNAFAQKYVELKDITADYTVEKVADGIWLCRGISPVEKEYTDAAEVRRILHMYVMPDGLYTMIFNDTPTGWAFAESVTFGEEEKPTDKVIKKGS